MIRLPAKSLSSALVGASARLVGVGLVGVGLAGVPLTACGSSDDSDDETSVTNPCEREVAHLRECGLLGEQDPGFCDDNLLDRCEHDCFAKASCEELRTSICRRAGLPPEGSALAACAIACLSAQSFMCGDSTSVASSLVCNGAPDCSDGSDESPLLCTNLVCASGETWPKIYQCDGTPLCSDRSDEQNCPQFTCTSGETILELKHCDGFPDCADSSDEVGCPPTMWDQVNPYCG